MKKIKNFLGLLGRYYSIRTRLILEEDDIDLQKAGIDIKSQEEVKK